MNRFTLIRFAIVLGLFCQSANPARAEEPLKNISFDAIKFDIKKKQPFVRKMLTPEIEKLDGKRVRLRGFILPGFQNKDLSSFVLMRDNMECCFGPEAFIFDSVIVEMAPGETADFTTKPVAVDGTFEIREVKNSDGTHLAIYHMTADRVR